MMQGSRRNVWVCSNANAGSAKKGEKVGEIESGIVDFEQSTAGEALQIVGTDERSSAVTLEVLQAQPEVILLRNTIPFLRSSKLARKWKVH